MSQQLKTTCKISLQICPFITAAGPPQEFEIPQIRNPILVVHFPTSCLPYLIPRSPSCGNSIMNDFQHMLVIFIRPFSVFVCHDPSCWYCASSHSSSPSGLQYFVCLPPSPRALIQEERLGQSIQAQGPLFSPRMHTTFYRLLR